MKENNDNNQSVIENKKYISKYEFVSYIVGASMFALFMGVINSYRADYLNNILMLSEKNQKIINIVTVVVGYILGFFVTYFIDSFKGKKGKFRPLALTFCIPYAIFGFFMFFTPFKDANSTAALFWIICVVIIYNVLNTFASTSNSVAIVMTPNDEERNKLFSVNSFFTSIMGSAPLVVILVLGFFQYKYDDAGQIISGHYSKNTMYIIALALCGILYVIAMINAMLKTEERIPYLNKKNSMFNGISKVLQNKNFWWLTISHQVRNLRNIGTGFGIFVAGAILGDTSKFLLFGLPTGIGTFVGMLIVQKMIKKTDPIKVYWIFGIYSLIANTIAFIIGIWYLSTGGSALQILFIVVLFLIGLQFGASNIIPNIFNADILNELELQTGGMRLEQTISFTQGFFGMIMGIITGILTPKILLSVCGYNQGVNAIQTVDTQKKLIFFYTMFVGIFFAVSLIPMLGYDLSTKKRKKINALLEIEREKRATENEKNENSSNGIDDFSDNNTIDSNNNEDINSYEEDNYNEKDNE